MKMMSVLFFSLLISSRSLAGLSVTDEPVKEVPSEAMGVGGMPGPIGMGGMSSPMGMGGSDFGNGGGLSSSSGGNYGNFGNGGNGGQGIGRSFSRDLTNDGNCPFMPPEPQAFRDQLNSLNQVIQDAKNNGCTLPGQVPPTTDQNIEQLFSENSCFFESQTNKSVRDRMSYYSNNFQKPILNEMEHDYFTCFSMYPDRTTTLVVQGMGDFSSKKGSQKSSFDSQDEAPAVDQSQIISDAQKCIDAKYDEKKTQQMGSAVCTYGNIQQQWRTVQTFAKQTNQIITAAIASEDSSSCANKDIAAKLAQSALSASISYLSLMPAAGPWGMAAGLSADLLNTVISKFAGDKRQRLATKYFSELDATKKRNQIACLAMANQNNMLCVQPTSNPPPKSDCHLNDVMLFFNSLPKELSALSRQGIITAVDDAKAEFNENQLADSFGIKNASEAKMRADSLIEGLSGNMTTPDGKTVKKIEYINNIAEAAASNASTPQLKAKADAILTYLNLAKEYSSVSLKAGETNPAIISKKKNSAIRLIAYIKGYSQTESGSYKYDSHEFGLDLESIVEDSLKQSGNTSLLERVQRYEALAQNNALDQGFAQETKDMNDVVQARRNDPKYSRYYEAFNAINREFLVDQMEKDAKKLKSIINDTKKLTSVPDDLRAEMKGLFRQCSLLSGTIGKKTISSRQEDSQTRRFNNMCKVFDCPSQNGFGLYRSNPALDDNIAFNQYLCSNAKLNNQFERNFEDELLKNKSICGKKLDQAAKLIETSFW